jgi:hypothetical protein
VGQDYISEKMKIERNVNALFSHILTQNLGQSKAYKVIGQARDKHQKAQAQSLLEGETPITILAQRRIEIELIKPYHELLVTEEGLEKANQLIGLAIVKDAQSAGQQKAALIPGPTDLLTFAEILPQWAKGGALEMTVLESTKEKLRYKVTRCRYAEMYKQMGLSELGFLVSCGRDGAFMEGYAPKVALSRPKTIMAGDDICDFCYYFCDR